MARYGTLGEFLGAQVCRLWWWVRGLKPSDGPPYCRRCGHNGRIHLWGGGCRRFVPAVVDWRSRRWWGWLRWRIDAIGLMRGGEILLQQPVDEDVATPDPAEEETLGRIVQEVDVASGREVVIPEAQTEHRMLETRPPPVSEPSGEPDE